MPANGGDRVSARGHAGMVLRALRDDWNPSQEAVLGAMTFIEDTLRAGADSSPRQKATAIHLLILIRRENRDDDVLETARSSLLARLNALEERAGELGLDLRGDLSAYRTATRGLPSPESGGGNPSNSP